MPREIDQVDDETLDTALSVLNEEIEDGTENIYRILRDDAEDSVYQTREPEPEPQKIPSGQEYPRGSTVIWGSNRLDLEEELEDRGII